MQMLPTCILSPLSVSPSPSPNAYIFCCCAANSPCVCPHLFLPPFLSLFCPLAVCLPVRCCCCCCLCCLSCLRIECIAFNIYSLLFPFSATLFPFFFSLLLRTFFLLSYASSVVVVRWKRKIKNAIAIKIA